MRRGQTYSIGIVYRLSLNCKLNSQSELACSTNLKNLPVRGLNFIHTSHHTNKNLSEFWNFHCCWEIWIDRYSDTSSFIFNENMLTSPKTESSILMTEMMSSRHQEPSDWTVRSLNFRPELDHYSNDRWQESYQKCHR